MKGPRSGTEKLDIGLYVPREIGYWFTYVQGVIFDYEGQVVV